MSSAEPLYAELAAATNFSFLRGASSPSDIVETALALGHTGIGIADRNSVAGVVRAYAALRNLRETAEEEGDVAAQERLDDFKLVVGARLVFADGTPDIIAYPMTRLGWGRLTRLLTLGNLRTTKGDCLLLLDELIAHAQEMALIVLKGVEVTMLARLRAEVNVPLYLGVTMHRAGRDHRSLAEHMALSAQCGIPLIALNDVLYASPEQRPLHDILTAIREKTTVQHAGRLLGANAERHLKGAHEMARLFTDAPEAMTNTQEFLAKINFSLDQLKYEYPHEPVPPGYSPQGWLEELIWTKAHECWGDTLPPKLEKLLHEELAIIAKAQYAPYFLTVHDIVAFAQSQSILCQGRGSAANSAVCYVLGITAVDPTKYNLLFSRFISEERKEPPDIDVDFEHERREEVMQYVYKRYGRHRAGIVATIIHYRPRSAVREVGKALGLSEDLTSRLTGSVWGSHARGFERERITDAGFDPDNPEIARLGDFVQQILRFPRHLSQHVGGFVLTQDRLDETVPIHNAAMEDRTFIEWDKDDIDALGLMKIDVLALGMLSCIRKAFDLISTHSGKQYTLQSIPDDAADVYAMLQKGDSVGLFQVESRAQMNMLPRLKPEEFYDLAIQVAIVRPGPIQGDMVHPYLRRRQGREAVEFPSPAPPHDRNELRGVLGKTLGVPLFQEQAMRLAITAAEFTPSESNQLRRAMATFRNLGTIQSFREKMVGGMVRRGYEPDFAERCFKQIEGFGSYGFPESHAIAFARLVWVSAYLRCRYPAAFAAALLNSQPMGFYAPAQIVRDAIEHGVTVLPIDVNTSAWDNAIEGGNLRLGLRQIDGFREVWATSIVANIPYSSVEELARRAQLPQAALRLLADADALGSLKLNRRDALWEVRRTPSDELPLFAAARARELAIEPAVNLPQMSLGEQVAADYQTIRLSLKAHPMHFLRASLDKERVTPCGDLISTPNGKRIKVAGIVLVRQRPGKGNAIFITLEDEGGIANIVLWARQFERYRKEVMGARLLLIDGELQRSPEGVMHVMASRVTDRTAMLQHLSDTHDANPPTARADEDLEHPPQFSRLGHPRNVRTIPKSRDFH